MQALSDKMLLELQRLQQSSAALPAHLQASFHGLSDGVAVTIGDLRGIVTADLPLNDKVLRLRATVEEKVQPLLESAAAAVQETLRAVSRKSEGAVDGVRERAAEGEETAKQNGVNNHN